MTHTPEPDDNPSDDLQTAWHADTTEILPMSLEAVQRRARRSQLFSDIDFYGGVVCVLALFGITGVQLMVINDGLLRLGMFLTALGGAFIIGWYYRHRPTGHAVIRNASQACLDHYRASLKKRIRLVRTAWAWQLLPMTPGPVLMMYRTNQLLAQLPPGAPFAAETGRMVLWGCETLLALTFVGMVIYWEWRARLRTRELQALGG